MIVSPFADDQARGTFGKGITAIRRRGIVYSKPYKVPKNPRSSPQISQRDLFTKAVRAWQGLTAGSRQYYIDLAVGQIYTGFNLFVQNYLNTGEPSTTPQTLMDVTNMNITTTRSPHQYGWFHAILESDTTFWFSWIYDYDNLFNDNFLKVSPVPVMVWIDPQNAVIDIHHRDTLSMTFDGGAPFLIYLPKIDFEVYLYIADDGSTYWDVNMNSLACASGF